MSYKIAAVYCFTNIKNPEKLQQELETLCHKQHIKGTLLVAHEGVNGTVAGTEKAINELSKKFHETLNDNMELKYSEAEEMPFLRMKVKIKKEIVTMGIETQNLGKKGKYVTPDNWDELTSDPNTIIIDTRNDYEVQIGTFKNAINPNTENFRQFPDWFDNFSENIDENTNIAMFCTGGIRCEKATAYVTNQGYNNVFHLKGGILKYLEETPEKESSWEGDCFVFDQRVAVKHGLQESDYELCYACRIPITPENKKHIEYKEGISCEHCYDTTTKEQKAKFRNRQHQVRIAKEKGRTHIGSDSLAEGRKAKEAKKEQTRQAQKEHQKRLNIKAR